jgi:hypothetical protein
MEFISSMTGKSPSTTGAGSEGALTKGPFNALPPIIDLNAALVSLVLTEHDVLLTCAGYLGPKVRIDHDVSLLVPEVLSRMTAVERDAKNLIADGCLERISDFEHAGRTVHASRLGYRITSRFVRIYFGRVFTHPHTVFSDEMLRPELQDKDIFADGVDNIVATHRRVAESYFKDGGIDLACPPLRALLHIMVYGHFDGHALGSPEVRALFGRDQLLASAWYAERLRAKQRVDEDLWQRHVGSLEQFLDEPRYAEVAKKLGIQDSLRRAKAELESVKGDPHLLGLKGTIGRQPL